MFGAQSVSSLEQRKNSTKEFLPNQGTTIILRNTDKSTIDYIKSLLPSDAKVNELITFPPKMNTKGTYYTEAIILPHKPKNAAKQFITMLPFELLSKEERTEMEKTSDLFLATTISYAMEKNPSQTPCNNLQHEERELLRIIEAIRQEILALFPSLAPTKTEAEPAHRMLSGITESRPEPKPFSFGLTLAWAINSSYQAVYDRIRNAIYEETNLLPLNLKKILGETNNQDFQKILKNIQEKAQ